MQPDREPLTVLHVDDEPDFADMVATFVRRENDRLDVETATSARDGLQVLEDRCFDCVVSDYDMPEQNGIEFLEAVRETHPNLPFILYTGKGSEEVASDAISAGVTDYLQKEGGTSQYAVLANRIKNSIEKHRAQTELADREQELALFFEQSPLGVVQWDADFDFGRVNESAEDILGYSGDELRGRSWEVIVPESDRVPVEDVVSDLLEDQGGYRSVNENVRKDGERIVCEWHNRVVTRGGDEVVTIFSQFQDITERRRQARRLETLIDNLPGMVYRCKNERGWPMEYVRGEVEDLTGYPRSLIEGRDGFYGTEVIHPDDREEVYEDVQAAVGAGDPFELTYRIVTSDGATKWVWERGRGIESADGDLAALEGFITDNTDHRQRRREAVE